MIEANMKFIKLANCRWINAEKITVLYIDAREKDLYIVMADVDDGGYHMIKKFQSFEDAEEFLQDLINSLSS
ncbi:MAG: hypothetical protein ABSA33_04585 [Candidatus Micrarchaeaceae archaeon]|jgi:hypothetical protein